MADDRGPLRSVRAGPPFEPENLLVELAGKRLRPLLQLIGDELLKDIREGVLRPDFLIAGHFVDQRDDADRGTTVDQNVSSMGYVVFPFPDGIS